MKSATKNLLATASFGLALAIGSTASAQVREFICERLSANEFGSHFYLRVDYSARQMALHAFVGGNIGQEFSASGPVEIFEDRVVSKTYGPQGQLLQTTIFHRGTGVLSGQTCGGSRGCHPLTAWTKPCQPYQRGKTIY